jgi:DMSO reductase anchor subunit
VSNIAQKIEQKLFNYGASQNVAKRWLVEIVSWILSALCMVGIIVVLCIYQQRPLPKWPLGITLNAYISLLAKIGSAAILFPVSGALGQLKWNWFQAKDERSKRSKMVWDFE